MVFQQNCQAPVWGKAVPGAEVKVIPSWNNKVYTAVADAEGRWQVSIPTPKGSFKKHTLTISDGEPVVLRNVAVGEVWLASEQSNMEMSFDRLSTRLANQDGILNADKYADVRILNVSRATGMVERDFFSAEFGKWVESSPETIRNFSAAGWYFGRKLMDELGVPVGIINSSWGGTIIEAWIGEGTIKSFPEALNQLALVKKLPDDEAERDKVYEKEIEAFLQIAKSQDLGLNGGVPVWAQPLFDDSSWKTISLPRKVQELWPATNGIYWFRKEIDIPSGWEGHDLTLSLGPVRILSE